MGKVIKYEDFKQNDLGKFGLIEEYGFFTQDSLKDINIENDFLNLKIINEEIKKLNIGSEKIKVKLSIEISFDNRKVKDSFGEKLNKIKERIKIEKHLEV